MILILIGCNSVCLSQEKLQTKNITSFFFGLGISNRQIRTNPTYQAINGSVANEVDSILKNGMPWMNFTAGILVERDRQKNWQPKFGMILQSYARRATFTYTDRVSLDDSIVIQTNHQTNQNRDNYLGIPIGIRKYWRISQKSIFSFNAGFRPDIYLFSYEKRIQKFDTVKIKQSQISRADDTRAVSLATYLFMSIGRPLKNGNFIHFGLFTDVHLTSDYVSAHPMRHRWASMSLLLSLSL